MTTNAEMPEVGSHTEVCTRRTPSRRPHFGIRDLASGPTPGPSHGHPPSTASTATYQHGPSGTQSQPSPLGIDGRAAYPSPRRTDEGEDSMAKRISRGMRINLSGVLGWAELLEVGRPQDLYPQFKDIGRDLRTCGERLMQLADRVRVLLEIQDPGVRPEPAKAGQRRPFSEVNSTLADTPLADGAPVQRKDDLRFNLREGCIQIPAKHLQLLVGELVDNAMRFSQPGQSVTVTSSYERDRYQIIVTDCGCGMSPQLVATQGATADWVQATGDDHEGGLGLAMVRRLCHLYEGQLRIESCLGVGTRVTVSIPGLVCHGCSHPSHCPTRASCTQFPATEAPLSA